jgi:acyl-CoA reductase-like NAD-dependent aldehyde dehydrogenase
LKRKIYVVDALHDVFAERFTARVAAMHAGDGFAEGRQMRQGDL